MWRESDDLSAAADDLSVARLVASGALAVVGAVLLERSWYALLHGLGVTVGRRDATSLFFVSQVGKYLPGSVWPVLAQMRFGARWGIPRRLMFAANVLLIAAIVATGVVVGALLLPWSSPDGLARYWWLLLLLGPLVVVLHPRLLPTLLDKVLERLGREPTRARLTGRGLAASIAWAVAAWVVYGAHVLVLAGAYGTPDAAEVAAATGGIALGWAAGIAFIPAPAGAGVRDGVLTLTLAPLLGTAPALAVALASRVVILLVDVVLAAAGTVSDRALAAPTSAPDRATSA